MTQAKKAKSLLTFGFADNLMRVAESGRKTAHYFDNMSRVLIEGNIRHKEIIARRK